MPQDITLDAYARQTGQSVATVRKRAQRGRLPGAYKGPDDRWRIVLPDGDATVPPDTSSAEPDMSTSSGPDMSSVAALERLVALLERELTHARDETRRRDAELASTRAQLDHERAGRDEERRRADTLLANALAKVADTPALPAGRRGLRGWLQRRREGP